MTQIEEILILLPPTPGDFPDDRIVYFLTCKGDSLIDEIGVIWGAENDGFGSGVVSPYNTESLNCRLAVFPDRDHFAIKRPGVPLGMIDSDEAAIRNRRPHAVSLDSDRDEFFNEQLTFGSLDELFHARSWRSGKMENGVQNSERENRGGEKP